MRIIFTACCAILAPFLVTLLLLVPNGAAILFPAAFKTARTPGAGLDLMGQRMIFGFGQLLVLVLSLVPGASIAAVFFIIAYGLFGLAPAVALVVATLLVVLVFVGEIWCVLWWLGERFEKLDISAELRA